MPNKYFHYYLYLYNNRIPALLATSKNKVEYSQRGEKTFDIL